MPRRSKKRVRPTNPTQSAVRAMRAATGEEEPLRKSRKKTPAQELGAKGGKKRAEKLTPERRREIAIKAAKARWKNSKNDKEN